MDLVTDFLFDNLKLPSLPAVAMRILDAVKKEDTSFQELSKIISTDPALVAKTLKIVNSSLFARQKKIDSLEKAVGLLGFTNLKNIALSYVIAKEFRGQGEAEFDFNAFWKRSVTASIAADLTKNVINYQNPDVFVTSLLQNIGILIMYICKPEKYLQVLDERLTTSLPSQVIEKHIFGFDHQEIGSEVLKKWGFPENIYLPIKYHHDTKNACAEYEIQIEILQVSDAISRWYHQSRNIRELEFVNDILGNKHGIPKKEIENLIDRVAENSTEMLSSFEIRSNEILPYSQILRETNEELEKLNLSYAQLLISYKEEKERAEFLAKQLKEKNEKLREISQRDGLTNLLNHKHFHETFDKEFNRAKRYRRPLSLIMLDIDLFKKINDTYGHRVGDIVLKELSNKITAKVRQNDLVARYGGEEFAIILPETDLTGSKLVSERIRSTVEQSEIVTESHKINITVSLGLAAYDPYRQGEMSKENLLDTADAAMYISKKNGRNRVTIHE